MTSVAAIASAHHLPAVPLHAQFDGVLLLGLASSIATIGCYMIRHRSPFAMLTFAASLLAVGVYGCMEGAWPLGMLEAAWAFSAARRGMRFGLLGRSRTGMFVADLSQRRSRYAPISGSN